MEDKVKKVAVRSFDRVFNKLDPNEINIEWNGLDITVKKTISISSMLEFVDGVVKLCFNKDTGEFMPEIKECAIMNGIISYYTNINMPAKFSKRYEWFYRTDIVGAIISHIDQSQYQAVLRAIDSKLDYLSRERIEAATKQVNEVYLALHNLTKKFEDVFDGVDKGDFLKAVNDAHFFTTKDNMAEDSDSE